MELVDVINKVFKWEAKDISKKLILKLYRLRCCGNCEFHKNDFDTLKCKKHNIWCYYDNCCECWKSEKDIRFRHNPLK